VVADNAWAGLAQPRELRLRFWQRPLESGLARGALACTFADHLAHLAAISAAAGPVAGPGSAASGAADAGDAGNTDATAAEAAAFASAVRSVLRALPPPLRACAGAVRAPADGDAARRTVGRAAADREVAGAWHGWSGAAWAHATAFDISS